MNNMNPFENIPPAEIQFFKEKVQHWLQVDKQISEIEKTLRELKKVRNKELEPEITKFMTKHKQIWKRVKHFDFITKPSNIISVFQKSGADSHEIG